MRILHIIPTLEQGGAERLLVDIVANETHCQHVICKMVGGQHFFDSRLNCRSVDLGLRRHPRTLVQLPIAAWRLIKVLRAERPDVVIGWLYYGAFLSVLARPFGARVCWSLHASRIDELLGINRLGLLARVLAMLARWGAADCVHYCSDGSRDEHAAYGFPLERTVVLPNGVDTERFRPVPKATDERPPGGADVPDVSAAMARCRDDSGGLRPLQVTPAATMDCAVATGRAAGRPSEADLIARLAACDRPRIGCVARFEPQKDHQTLFAALSILAKRGESFTCVLVGRGCDDGNPAMKELARRHGIEDRIAALGTITEIEKVYQHLDVLVLSAAYGESMPLSLLEGLASGRQIVATDVGAIRSMLGPHGDIAPPRNPDQLADALLNALRNPDKDDRSAAIRHDYVAQRYDIRSVSDAWAREVLKLDPAIRQGAA